MQQLQQEETKSKFTEAYQKTFGNISMSCLAVGINRSTYYRWLESDPEFKKALDELQPREAFKDFIESALMKKIKEGDTACIIFASKTLSKDRGYVERTEHEFKTDEPIEVELRIT